MTLLLLLTVITKSHGISNYYACACRKDYVRTARDGRSVWLMMYVQNVFCYMFTDAAL